MYKLKVPDGWYRIATARDARDGDKWANPHSGTAWTYINGGDVEGYREGSRDHHVVIRRSKHGETCRVTNAMQDVFDAHDRAMRGEFDKIEDIYCLLLYRISCLKKCSGKT